MRREIVILCLIVGAALVGPYVSPYAYDEIALAMKNMPPSAAHWWGTDELGRDLCTRTLYATRLSLLIGALAALIDGCIGVVWGSIAAYTGGKTDETMMRLCDVVQSIPSLLVVILLTVVCGSGIGTLILAMTCTGWISMARICRSQIVWLKEQDFIKAAIILGACPPRIVVRHLLPNAISPLIATATLTIPLAIFTESFLSFLGLGIQPPSASLGSMINDGLSAVVYYPWRLFVPAGAMTVIMLTLNVLGNSLSEMSANKAYPFARRAKGQNIDRTTGLLNVRDLTIGFEGRGNVVRGISFTVEENQSVAIVGESGSGKTVSVHALFGFLPTAQIAGSISFAGRLGVDVGMIFQDPMHSLNPTMTIGAQIAEGLIYHKIMQPKEAKARATALLSEMGFTEPENYSTMYPHQLSGGQRQRVMIAIAAACNPRLLIADEPTTALDKATQKQVVALLQNLRKRSQMSLIFITHDLSLVSELCDTVYVMYAGKIVEQGSVASVLTAPRHPYTKALVQSIPTLDTPKDAPLFAIPGFPPSRVDQIVGCPFAPRCRLAQDQCKKHEPSLSGNSACWETME
ncbi:MAG: hypothetical protein RL235_533 [Chlamydiota bacterium]|jgi:oligopeptide/dipeptide ABC transporter ATP-binding protein